MKIKILLSVLKELPLKIVFFFLYRVVDKKKN